MLIYQATCLPATLMLKSYKSCVCCVRCNPHVTGGHTDKLLKPVVSVVCMTISGLIPPHLLQQLLMLSSGAADSLLCVFTEH